MQIDNRIEKLLDVFLNCGYEAYLVGGCVRDSLMGFVPHDYDITTNALPEQIKGLLEKYKTYDIGIKFGTVAVDFDGLLVEITTYRTEKDYDDNRHPKTVEFSKSINEDLSRRDFTINAIAYNNKNGFVDIYNGREDIQNKIIKCVGIPDERFFEDGLRIIRALRFSATLGFEIEENTKKSIKKHKYLLKNLAKERIFTELSKLLMGRNAKNILN
ncbi:MAG: hypothetical protein IJX26_01210 [Clostridia bacterium]|nr:hypothetical protein [Clostridia bacterium]